MLKHMITFAAVAGLVLALAPAAQAATIVPTVAIDRNHDRGGSAAELISGVGMSPGGSGAAVTTSSTDDGTSGWGSHQGGFSGSGDAPNDSTDLWAAFGFSLPAVLDTLDIWNDNGNHSDGGGMKNFNFYTLTAMPATTDSFSTILSTLVSSTVLNDPGLAVGTGPGATKSGTYSLGGITAQYVLIQPTQNHKDAYAVAFDQLRFDGELIPEPATLALLGLGGIGVLLRRRRA